MAGLFTAASPQSAYGSLTDDELHALPWVSGEQTAQARANALSSTVTEVKPIETASRCLMPVCESFSD